MKVGDIIQEKQHPYRRGLVVEIDPLLKRAWRQPPLNEIIILLTNGTLFYADPKQWKQIVEV